MNVLYCVANRHLNKVYLEQLSQLHLDLIQQEYAVTLLYSASGSRIVQQAYQDNSAVELLSLPVIHPDKRGALLSHWRFLKRVFRDTKFDVVSVDCSMLGRTLLALLGKKAPLVVTIDSNFIPTFWSRCLLKLKRVSQIMVASEDDRDYVMERIGLDGDIVNVAYDGFYEGQVQESESQSKPEIVGIPNDAFTIGLGCENMDSANLNAAITAFDHICVEYPNAYLVLAGISRADLRASNTNLSSEQLQKVRFIDGLGLCSGDFSLFDLFLLVSRPSRGISALLKEITSHGAPVIAFDSAGNREVISHMQSGFLVPENDIDEIYKMISFAIQNPTKTACMAAKAKAFVSNAMSHGARTKRAIQIYQKAVSQNALPPIDSVPSNS